MNTQMIEEFKTHFVDTMNENMYYELKDWVAQNIDDDDLYGETLDYMVQNINGDLQWVD